MERPSGKTPALNDISTLARKHGFAHRPFHILLAVVTLVLAACGGGANDNADADNRTQSASTDTGSPSVTITGPVSGPSHSTNSATVVLSGSASDNVGVTQVSWSNNRGGSGTASGTTSWSVSGIALQSGTNTLTVTARDAAGNTSSDTLTVTYSSTAPGDTTVPGITINSPTSGSTYTTSSGTLSLSGSASDNVGVTQVSWSNNRGGSGTASGTTSWSVSGIALQSGTNTLTVTARDAAGNSQTDALIVTYSTGTSTRNTFYLSPTGSDSNNGQSPTSPWKSFSKAFGVMAAGDELILMDGTYSEAAGTGYISYLGNKSAQVPSGTSVNNMTYVHALNPGNVTVQGEMFIGRSFRKDSYIKIQGITFEGGGSLYNTSHVIVKDCGFHGYLGVGSNDHEMGNSYALLEDVWVWGNDRIMLIVYRSDHVVVRRAVVRNDGCYSASADCGNNSGNAMVGTTIYNSHHVSFQNVLAVDNVLGPNGYSGASDFSVAWHDNYFYPWHRNEWLGSMSINTGLGASFYYDIDNLTAAEQPMATYKDIVAINTPLGFAANMNCGSGCAAHNITVHNATFRPGNSSGDALWVNSNFSQGVIDIKNIIALGSGSIGISVPQSSGYMDVNGFGTAYQQAACSTGCYTSNAMLDGATPSLKYPIRIEDGGFLKGKGLNGADIGANVMYRYGADGAFYGDAGYNTLSSMPLWPWPNEYRIKREMCASTTRGFCSTGQRLGNLGPVTLTTYIWEYLGHSIPAGVYP